MADSTPVNVVGFTWGAAGSWGTFIVAVLGLIGLFVRQIGPWRKQTTDAEMQLRKEMSETIRDQKAEIQRLEDKIDHVEQLREHDRVKYEAERSLDRHKLNNFSQILDTIFLMLETNPEKVPEVVQKMRDMRARQLEAEAIESATLRAEAVKSKEPS